MIDTKELRKLTQAATPGPWFSDARGNIWRRSPSDLYENGGSVAGDKPIAFVVAGWAGEGVTGYPAEDNTNFIAAANPAVISELLDRLEAAERERDECNARRLEAADHFSAQVREISSALEETRRERDVEEQRACDLHVECCNLITEIDALRAKIERMERQEPVAWYSKQYGFVYMSRHHSQFEHGSILYLRNGTPAWRIEGSSKVALLDIASLPHGTVFYASPAKKENRND